MLATDSDGLVYGINNYISNLTLDVQSQINTINTTLANKKDLLTAANKLDMAYIGIDDIINFLVTEYIKGNLRDDNNSIDEYVNTLRTMMKDNADDEKFTNDMKNLFNDVKNIDEYNPDDEDGRALYAREDFEGNENIPSER